jgi:hypothetical protein
MYAGMPYKTVQHGSNMKHCGTIATYWSLSILLKIIFSKIV